MVTANKGMDEQRSNVDTGACGIGIVGNFDVYNAQTKALQVRRVSLVVATDIRFDCQPFSKIAGTRHFPTIGALARSQIVSIDVDIRVTAVDLGLWIILGNSKPADHNTQNTTAAKVSHDLYP